MTTITTHVLDVYHGRPASGVKITASMYVEGDWEKVKTVETNAQGRCDEPIFEQAVSGKYELTFSIDTYFEAQGVALAQPHFLNDIPVRFQISDEEAHYHIPLIVSPWNYQVYRGS